MRDLLRILLASLGFLVIALLVVLLVVIGIAGRIAGPYYRGISPSEAFEGFWPLVPWSAQVGIFVWAVAVAICGVLPKLTRRAKPSRRWQWARHVVVVLPGACALGYAGYKLLSLYLRDPSVFQPPING